MARAAKPRNAERAGRSLVLLQGLLIGALVALATPSALLFGVLLAPGLVALALDQSPGRPIARAMLLFGLAATIAPLTFLWKSGHTLELATTQIADAQVVAAAWSAAAAGWLVAQLSPLAVRMALESAALARKRRLTTARNRCAADWGFPASHEAG